MLLMGRVSQSSLNLWFELIGFHTISSFEQKKNEKGCLYRYPKYNKDNCNDQTTYPMD